MSETVNYGRGYARVDAWLDIKLMRPLYGVSVKRGGEWMRLAADGAAYLVKSKAEAREMALKLARREDRRP